MSNNSIKRGAAQGVTDEQPWDDLKVAFGIDDSDAFEKWIEDTDDGRDDLPLGWTLCETDASGARYVAVFRVEGPLRDVDAAAVQLLLSRHGGYQATPPAPAPEKSSESSDSDAGEEVTLQSIIELVGELSERDKGYLAGVLDETPLTIARCTLSGLAAEAKAVEQSVVAYRATTPQPPAVEAESVKPVAWVKQSTLDSLSEMTSGASSFQIANTRFAAWKHPLYSEAALSTVRASQTSLLKAQTDEIALAQAERDFWRTADAKSVERAEAAEAKIKELELHLYDYEREIH